MTEVYGGAIGSGKRTRLMNWALANDIPIVTTRDEFIEFLNNSKPRPDGKKTLVFIDGDLSEHVREQRRQREQVNETLERISRIMRQKGRRHWAVFY